MNNKQLIFHDIYLSNYASTVGKNEYEGPLGSYFDAYEKDEYFGCDSFEKAECEMVRRNLNILCNKAKIGFDDIDLILGGDLINQCTSTSFAVSNTNTPYIGLYGACSTIIESLICGAAFLSTNNLNNAVCMASSHFCSAERQYRFPLEYGSLRTPTSQNTVTATGAFLINKSPSKIKLTKGIIGKIVDKGVTDANNMGAAMAGAAVDTIKRFVELNDKKIDIVVTGDLGAEGHEIARELLALEGIDLGDAFTDCGKLIYDIKNQDMACGGSGCGCIASVFAGYFTNLLETECIKNILLVGTGALLNPNSVFEKRHIPGIAHAIYLTTEE